MSIRRTTILTCIICLPFSVPFVTASTVELSPMSIKPFKNYMDCLIAEQMRRGLTTNNVLNINAMDDLDPVHVRLASQQRDQGEADHDGDMGREQQDYDRDNGKSCGGFIAPAWQQLATTLPETEAPSIVPDQPDTQADSTIAYLKKREASE